MKHLVHKIHHPHLKKRALLELAGLTVLVAISFSQREIIQEAIQTVARVEVVWFLVLLAIYWIVLPLTAVSYKFISPKPHKLRIITTTLAHLAGAGPGRIIPGGIGNLSISAMHLKKTGLTIEQAIAVVATNNLIGMIMTVLLVMVTLIIRPDTLRILTNNITSSQLLIASLVIIGLIVMLQWLLHARSTKREIHKTLHQWRIILKKFLRQPKRVFQVMVISLVIALLHTLMIDFSAFALNIELDFMNALIALSFGVAIGGIFPTPGGVGGVEAGITAALIALGYDPASATSIAVLYRVATYGQPLLPGAIAYLYLRERQLI